MDLSQLALAEDVLSDGAWIAPRLGETHEFKCVVKTSKFKAREIRAIRELAKHYGDTFAIPTHAEAARLGPVYFEEGLVRGVRGLFHDRERTKPVTLDELPGLVVQVRYAPLYEQMKLAVDMASVRVQSDADAALGNSARTSGISAETPPSKLSSETAASQ